MNKTNSGRRDFLRRTAAGLGALALSGLSSSCSIEQEQKTSTLKEKREKLHIVTLSFDDGFKKSSIRTAQIYEKYNLSACINVIATAHLDTYVAPGKYIKASKKGDFGLWNELKARGHEVMPHGFKHANKAKIPFEQAKGLILKCLDYFDENLDRFERKEAVFNFPYNASTQPLEEWLVTQVRAFRARGGAGGMNPLPFKGQVKLTTEGFGPGNCEHDIDRKVNQLIAADSGWLIYNVHGLDTEGWGPIRSVFLERLIQRLLAVDSVRIMPAGKALLSLASSQV